MRLINIILKVSASQRESENINGSVFSATFAYDDLGRLNSRTHPTGIMETYSYNNNGFLASISAGGETRWTVSAMNEGCRLPMDSTVQI